MLIKGRMERLRSPPTVIRAHKLVLMVWAWDGNEKAVEQTVSPGFANTEFGLLKGDF